MFSQEYNPSPPTDRACMGVEWRRAQSTPEGRAPGEGDSEREDWGWELGSGSGPGGGRGGFAAVHGRDCT